MKRRAIIAGLLATAGKLFAQRDVDGGLEVDLQHGQKEDLHVPTCVFVGAAYTGTMRCTYPVHSEPTYALTVKYGDRIVRLTAAQIMDALEGK